MPTGVSQGKIRTLRLSDVLKLSLEQTKLYFVNSSILTMFFGLKICEGGGDEGGEWGGGENPQISQVLRVWVRETLDRDIPEKKMKDILN